MRKSMLIVCLLLWVVTHGNAQPAGGDRVITPLYLDLNNADKSHVHEISTEVLSIQYYDGSGTARELPCVLYNWKQEPVAEFSMTKTFGQNQYNIVLKDVYQAWQKNSLYSLVAKNETGLRYQLFFKLTNPPKQDIAASILVNPKFLDCGGVSPNLVEFYGDIKGGKAPYHVSWFVLNGLRTGMLSHPRNEVIERQGWTSSIDVDKNPDYYVIMYVKDACGNERHQIVQLVCEKGKKKINTVFFERVVDELIEIGNN